VAEAAEILQAAAAAAVMQADRILPATSLPDRQLPFGLARADREEARAPIVIKVLQVRPAAFP
jgi:hypothetical protein